MKATIVGSEIRIDLYRLVEDMDTDERQKLADAVAVRDDVVVYVTQQILDKWTEHDSNAGLCCVAYSDPLKTMGLDWSVREVARRAGEVATSEIKRLEKALLSREEENATLRRMLDERRYEQ